MVIIQNATRDVLEKSSRNTRYMKPVLMIWLRYVLIAVTSRSMAAIGNVRIAVKWMIPHSPDDSMDSGAGDSADLVVGNLADFVNVNLANW